MTDEFLVQLRRSRLMAIIRGNDPRAAESTARVLLEEGVGFVEVALTTPDGLGVIERLRPHVPKGAWLGAGTVLSRADVERVESVGGQFIVTPAIVEAVDEAVCRSLPSVVGALSPTEIVTAQARGAAVVKLFPASAGGPAYLKAIRDPLPDVPILAVGGVGIDEARSFLAVGALGVGVGGPLVGDAASGGDLRALRTRVTAFLEVTRGVDA